MELEHTDGVNPSGNDALSDFLQSAISRRLVIGGGLAAAAISLFPTGQRVSASEADNRSERGPDGRKRPLEPPWV